MKIYNNPEDITAMGLHVKPFPLVIKEAFDNLMRSFGNERSYYGIGGLDENDAVEYYALTNETSKDEAKHYETLLIEKGEYVIETTYDWLNKTDSLKEVFHHLMPDDKPHKNHPCIEWYKSNDEMTCMIKADSRDQRRRQ